MPQPSRSLLPLRVIRATPCAPLPPQRVSRLPLRYVGRPGLLGTTRRWSAGSSPPVGLSHRLLKTPACAGQPVRQPSTAWSRWRTWGGPTGISGARRLAPELRTFGRVGCNRGVLGVLRVPALRSRVSARNGIECAAARCNVSASRSNALSGPARFVVLACCRKSQCSRRRQLRCRELATRCPRHGRCVAVSVFGSSRIAFRMG